MRDVNQETLTSTLSWYKKLTLDGFSLIRVQRRLHMRRREVCQNFWSRHINHKWFTQTTQCHLGKHVKIHHGITTLQHLFDPRRMASLKEPFDECNMVLKAALLRSGLDERWWSDSEGLLLLSTRRPRLPGRREISVRKTIWRTIHWVNNTSWSDC